MTHDMWHVILQSENAFELGGITRNITFALCPSALFARDSVSLYLPAYFYILLIQKCEQSIFVFFNRQGIFGEGTRQDYSDIE